MQRVFQNLGYTLLQFDSTSLSPFVPYSNSSITDRILFLQKQKQLNQLFT